MRTIACIDTMGIAKSPFFRSYATAETACGVYNNRVFPWHSGESATEHYWKLRQDAVLYDVPEMPIEVKGPDAEMLLNMVFTRDISKLRPGRAAYGVACLADGGILMDGVVMRLATDHFWYVQADGPFLPWLHAHGGDMDVTVRDPQSWVLQVQGPKSLEVLAAACDTPTPDPFRYFDVRECAIGGQRLVVSRTGWTGELGFELYTTDPRADGDTLWRHLLRVGEPYGLIWSPLRSMQIRRVEAGILDYGTDIDTGMTPFQAGLAKFVDLSKPDFIGKDALARADQRPVLYGVRCPDAIPRFRGTAEIRGITVGHVLSSTWSPQLEAGIAYLRFDEPGEWTGIELSVTTTKQDVAKAEVVPLPFFDPEKRIARGIAPD